MPYAAAPGSGILQPMSTVTDRTAAVRAAIAANRVALTEALGRYGASNPRLFGSVARGEAGETSDVDVLVDLDPEAGNPLLRVAGLGEELSRILGVRVDVVTESLLREPVSASVHQDAVVL